MKLTKWGAAALALGIVAATTSHTQAQTKAKKSNVQHAIADNARSMADELQEAELAQFNMAGVGVGFGGGAFASPNAAWPSLMDRPIQIVAGAQYIYARPSFSDALAYVRQDLVNGREEYVQYDFDYDSTYSFYGGIYLPDCGGAILFDWTRLSGDAAVAAAPTPGFVNIWGPYEIDGNIQGFANVELDSYDLAFSKTIPLGCALGAACAPACGDCCQDTCCDDTACGGGCGPGYCCPAWDITWTGGLRWANVGWGRGTTAFDAQLNNAVIDSTTSTMNFEGFGGRIGIAGRRYFGQRGLFSLYGSGDLSVLVGDIELNTVVFDASAAATASFGTSTRNIIPVTEVEFGGTVHLGAHANISAGYFFAAWHDLGFRDEYDFNQFQLSHYDDGNILGFDGFFARAEITF